jgi:hypothetical protein
LTASIIFASHLLLRMNYIVKCSVKFTASFKKCKPYFYIFYPRVPPDCAQYLFLIGSTIQTPNKCHHIYGLNSLAYIN